MFRYHRVDPPVWPARAAGILGETGFPAACPSPSSDPALVASSGISESGLPLYGAAPGFMRFPVGNATELVYCQYDRTRHLLSAADAKILQTCRAFSPLREHARRMLAEGNLDEVSV